MQNDIVVRARGIKKRYSDNNALNGLDLDLHQGQILGLIGPNGAGKSTFLHAVLGLLKSEGSLEVMGLEPFKNRHQLLKKVCSITDVAVLPKWMTVEQMLEYVEGVHPEFDPKKARSILSKTNIKNNSKIKIDFDEPASGWSAPKTSLWLKKAMNDGSMIFISPVPIGRIV